MIFPAVNIGVKMKTRANSIHAPQGVALLPRELPGCLTRYRKPTIGNLCISPLQDAEHQRGIEARRSVTALREALCVKTNCRP